MTKFLRSIAVVAGLFLSVNAGAQTVLTDIVTGNLQNPITPQIAGSLVYDSTTPGYFRLGGNLPAQARAFLFDDGFLPAGTGPTFINGMNFGFAVYGTDPTPIVATLIFIDTISPAGDPDEGSIIGLYQVPLGRPVNGFYQTGLIDLALLGGGFEMPDDDFGVAYIFSNPAGTALSTNATALFAGGPVAKGSNVDVFWLDFNGSFTFESTELVNFGGPPNRAQFFLQLNAVPEPGSVALLFGLFTAGAGVLARRRRK
jgi:hypothetical protein